MSAIAGRVNFDNRPVEREVLETMRQALRPYGRDNSALWMNANAGLVHRLTRHTPEDQYEGQPLQLENLVLVGDIRLDNRLELIDLLECERHDRGSNVPDSLLVLRAFKKWGKQSPEKLIGAFVFAIWNQRTQELFMARDQIGHRTVFYHRSRNVFTFASMPRGLYALSDIPKRLNEEKVAEFLVLNHRNHAKSFFREILRLPPAHLLTLDRSGATLQRYWALDPKKRIFLDSDNAYVDRCRELLEQAVQASLRSASPVGSMMSGGLDSSTVTCFASKLADPAKTPLQTFTQVPDVDLSEYSDSKCYFDETPLVEAIVSRNPDLASNYVRSSGLSLFHDLDRRFSLTQAPVRNVFNHIWIEAIHRMASQKGIRVLLTGQRGNMSISYDGYALLLSNLLRGRLLSFRNELSQLCAKTDMRLAKLIRSRVTAPLIPNAVWNMYRRIGNRGNPPWESYSAINPKFADDIGLLQLNASSGFDPTLRGPLDGRVARARILEGADFSGDNLKMLMAGFGTDVRDPTSDIRLIEFCLAIPENQFLRNGEPKWLIRRLMGESLPSKVLDNRKRGLQMADWQFRLELAKPQIAEELKAMTASQTASRIVDIPRLMSLMDNWPKIGNPASRSLAKYRNLLCRGVVVGRFIRWVEGDIDAGDE